MSRKSCFLIGHREASEKIYPALYTAIEEHIARYGVSEFMVGRYGGFDRLVVKAVKSQNKAIQKLNLPYCCPTIRQNVLFLYRMGLTVPISSGHGKVPARLLLSGQIGIWSIIPIFSLPMRGALPATQEIFWNMQGRGGKRFHPGDSLAAQ